MSEMNNVLTDVRGAIFPSQKAAAQAYGVTPSAVSHLLRTRGSLARLGCGLGGGQAGNRNGFQPKPVTIGVMTFASRQACATALGRNVRWVQRRVQPSARPALREELVRAVMELSAAQDRARAGR